MTRLAVATNTRRRYVMVVGGKPVTLEYVVARLHHARIVDVYIGYVYPCAHQMGAHVKPMRLHIVNVFLKEHHSLHIRAMALCLFFAKAEAVQTEAFVKIGCLHEYSNLRTAQWGLPYYAARGLAEHVGIQCRFAEHCVLIAYVAEEYFRVNYTATILLLFIDIFAYRSFEFFYAHRKRLSVFRIKNLVIFHVLFICK